MIFLNSIYAQLIEKYVLEYTDYIARRKQLLEAIAPFKVDPMNWNYM